MDRCVVRRAIKDTRTGEVIGYELLFQGNRDNLFAQPETSAADMISSFLMSNSNKFVSDKTMFITFTPSLLFRNTPKMFEPDKVVIQIDDNMVVNPLAKPFLKKYRRAGYQIAVSDFQFSLRYLDMLDDVSYIRLDMQRKEIYENEREKNSIKNIIAMARGIHKSGVGTFHTSVFGYVLPCRPIGNSLAFHHLKRATIGWRSVAKISVNCHIF